MTKIAFLLHLYQPVTQDERTFKGIVESSYIPLVKLIKNKKIPISLNIPLSVLEQLDNYRYAELINDIKNLVDQDFVNLTGSAAYHSLLTKLPSTLVEDQIVLNEYGNGFYFGRKTGFEGEQAILVKNFNGFFPPELAINSNVYDILSDLGYRWVLANQTSTEGKHGVFKLDDKECLIVSRNTKLSDLLAFKRNAEVLDIMNHFLNAEDSVIALDAETFGHHNSDGVFMLGKLFEKLLENNIDILSVDEFVEVMGEESLVKPLDKFTESTWAKTDNTSEYYLWEGNDIHTLQWKLLNETLKIAENKIERIEHEDMENVSLWQGELPKDVKTEILLQKCLHSDQFWWISGEVVGSTRLFNKVMVERSLALYKELADLLEDPKYEKLVTEYTDKIMKEINTNEANNPTTFLSTP